MHGHAYTVHKDPRIMHETLTHNAMHKETLKPLQHSAFSDYARA
jgi:hypothetical protein